MRGFPWNVGQRVKKLLLLASNCKIFQTILPRRTTAIPPRWWCSPTWVCVHFVPPTRDTHLGKVKPWYFSFRGRAEAVKDLIVYLSLIYTSPLPNIFRATLLWSTFNLRPRQIFHTHTVIVEIVMKLSSEWSLSIRTLFAITYTWLWAFQIILKFLVALARRLRIFVSQPIPEPSYFGQV